MDVVLATILSMSEYGIAEVSGEKEKHITGPASKQSSGTVPAPILLITECRGEEGVYTYVWPD